MARNIWILVAALAALAWPCAVAAQQVERASTPAWVEPVALEPMDAATADAAPIRVLAVSQQFRFTPEGVDTYTLRRYRVQSTQGLSLLSTVSAVWAPPRQTIQVNAIRILRGDQVIDALDGQDFQTLRRESNLEASTLDGVLTATLQPRDLRVGDILETAFTIRDDGGVLAPHREALDALALGFTIDRFSLRATWPSEMAMRAAGVGSWSDVAPRRTRDGWEMRIDRRGLTPIRLPDDLPPRYYFDRLIQITDFADWSQASAIMAPLYATAATLEPNSPLLAEIERIRAENATPAARAAAALGLVQDQVRYVALAMGEGGYRPASADDVWRSRYGDCKGKTALLLALLNGLGIEAEGAMVSTRLGADLDKRLPLIAWFDHILVKATVDGRTYWLDGTRTNDGDLASLTPPSYSFALPVRAEGGRLEPIEIPPAVRPDRLTIVTLDASAGLDAPAPVESDIVLTGDTATAYRQAVSVVPPDRLQTQLMSLFSDEDDTALDVDTVTSRYDESDRTFHIVMKGKLRLAWLAGAGGRILVLDQTALYSPVQADREGVFAEFKDAPYSNGYPSMDRIITRITLPNEGRGFRIEGGDQSVETAGHRLERTVALTDGVVEAVVTSTSLKPEITAEENAAAKTRNEGLRNPTVRIRAPADYEATEADRARLDAGDSDVASLIARAKALSDALDDNGALALLDAAIEKAPDDLKARLARAEAHYAARNYDAARADFDHAVDLDPADLKAVMGQGATALRDGRAADAVVSYSVALRLEPGDVDALFGRARAYYRLGRWERALQDFRALKTAAPASDTGPHGELSSLIRLERHDEVEALIDARLEDDPADEIALDARLRSARRQGRPADALPMLDAAASAAPDSDGVLELRAEARALSGRTEEARADFALLRSRAGADPVLLNNVCWSQARVGFDLQTALADCDAAIAAAPQVGFLDSRALVLLHLDRFEEAKALYDRILSEEPTQSASVYGRGLARRALGDAGGEEDITRALTLDVDAADDFAVFLARGPQPAR